MLTRRTLLAATAAAAAMLPGRSRAQAWPTRPVRIIVPYPPGSGTDIIGRIRADRLQAAWGQPVVVENRAGAGGTIGTEAGARAAPDGYSFLVSDVGPLAMAPSLYARLPYDTVRDFDPVSLMARLPFALVV
ncbi:MAG TPA: tripartite tricarboxylate transporter substrate-binding protein, partial [Roseomonas sp.]